MLMVDMLSRLMPIMAKSRIKRRSILCLGQLDCQAGLVTRLLFYHAEWNNVFANKFPIVIGNVPQSVILADLQHFFPLTEAEKMVVR